MTLSKNDAEIINERVKTSLKAAHSGLADSDFDDIKQDVVMVVVKRLKQLSDPPRSIEKYVSFTAHREIRKALKSFRKRQRQEHACCLVDELTTSRQDVYREVSQERLDAVREELDALTENERAALLSFVYKDDPHRNYQLKDAAIRKLRTRLNKRGLL